MGVIKIDDDITKPLFAFAEDVERAEEQMDANDDSYSRRNHIRAVFAMIEGTVYLLKQLALKGDSSAVPKLSMEERVLIEEMAFDLSDRGKVKRQQKHVKLTTNVRFTERCLEKVFGCTFNVNSTPNGWGEFITAIEIRNRITHPKGLKAFQVSKDESELARRVSHWFNQLILDWFHPFIANVRVVTKGEKTPHPGDHEGYAM